MKHPTSDVLVGEVAAALNECAGLLCVPSVEEEDGTVTLTLRVDPLAQPTTGGAVAVVELYNALCRVVDVGTLRAIATHYDINPQDVERLLPLDGQED